jgi:hypothetical protein
MKCSVKHKVNCSICGRTERKWSSLIKHIKRSHKNIQAEQVEPIRDDIDELTEMEEPVQLEESTEGESTNDNFEVHDNIVNVDAKREVALFLLKTAKELSLTHAAVDALYGFTQEFVVTVADRIHDKVIASLKNNNVTIDSNLENKLKEACKVENNLMD